MCRWGTPWRLWRSEHAQAAQFLAPQAVVEEGGQDGPVAFAFEGVVRGRFQQRPGLAVAQRGGFALIPLRFGAFDPAHRVMADGVDLAEVVKQGGDRSELAPDGALGQAPPFEVFAPGDSGGRG
jgi:hypothetical protein